MEKKLNCRLRETRISCNLTQQQVADKLKIDRSTYTYYETGKTKPSIFTLMELAKIFEVPIDDILNIK